MYMYIAWIIPDINLKYSNEFTNSQVVKRLLFSAPLNLFYALKVINVGLTLC